MEDSCTVFKAVRDYVALMLDLCLLATGLLKLVQTFIKALQKSKKSSKRITDVVLLFLCRSLKQSLHVLNATYSI